MTDEDHAAERRQEQRQLALQYLSIQALKEEVAKHKRISTQRLARAKAAEDIIKHLRAQLGHKTHGRPRKPTEPPHA